MYVWVNNSKEATFTSEVYDVLIISPQRRGRRKSLSSSTREDRASSTFPNTDISPSTSRAGRGTTSSCGADHRALGYLSSPPFLCCLHSNNKHNNRNKQKKNTTPSDSVLPGVAMMQRMIPTHKNKRTHSWASIQSFHLCCFRSQRPFLFFLIFFNNLLSAFFSAT